MSVSRPSIAELRRIADKYGFDLWQAELEEPYHIDHRRLDDASWPLSKMDSEEVAA